MISRRDFSFRLAGILAVAGPARLTDAQESAAKPASSTTNPSSAPDEGLSQTEQEEVESRYQNIIRVWGQRLSSEQRERVHRVLVSHARMMQPMRAFQLENGDPPAQVLRLMTETGATAEAKQAGLPDGSE